MRGINKVILVGNLGKDPEVRYMPDGKPVANFSIATSETWKDKNSGEKQEKTEWHNIVIFGALAEVVSQYVKKGSRIYLEGKIRTRKWQDKEGKDRYTTEIVGDQMLMLDGKSSGGERNYGAYPEAGKPEATPKDGAEGAPGKPNEFDDSIPF